MTGERIRDKIAASKAKGIWMGGPLPLGYDVSNRLLVINEAEAMVVRRIFDEIVQERSTTLMARQLALAGAHTKTGRKFCKQTIYKILHNRMYIGEITHKGKSFAGAQQPIITRAQWEAAHAVLGQDHRERRSDTLSRARPLSLLRGLLFTTDGERLMPTFTVKKGKTYRYYMPNQNGHYGSGASIFGSIPAEPLEELVLTQVRNALAAPHIVQAVWDQVRQIAPDITEPQVVLPMQNLATVWQQLFPPEQYRLVRLVVERVEIGSTGVEIVWRDAGWQSLADELRPGTIGAELTELETTV